MSQTSTTRNQALQLLAQNVAPSQVAAALGVTESAISQLLSQEDFSAELEQVRVAATAEDLKYDDRLDTAESDALSNIEGKLRFANMQQSLQAFKILNTARRRKESRVAAQQTGGGVVVNITLPTAIVPQYVTNPKNEIIEVEGKTMVSASPTRMEEILVARNGGAHKTVSIGITKMERAAQTLELVNPTPAKATVKRVPRPNLIDLV